MSMLRDLCVPVGHITQATAEGKTDLPEVRDPDLQNREGLRKTTMRLSKTELRLAAL